MRLNLREIIHVPGASLPFAFQLDLSQEEFFGEHPIPRPVQVQGRMCSCWREKRDPFWTIPATGVWSRFSGKKSSA